MKSCIVFISFMIGGSAVHAADTPNIIVIMAHAGEVSRELAVTARYLNIPVVDYLTTREQFEQGVKREAGADLLLLDGSDVVRKTRCLLPAAEEQADWIYSMDVGVFRGKTLRLTTKASAPRALEKITLSDAPLEQCPANLYNEPLRPQFHFSARLAE